MSCHSYFYAFNGSNDAKYNIDQGFESDCCRKINQKLALYYSLIIITEVYAIWLGIVPKDFPRLFPELLESYCIYAKGTVPSCWQIFGHKFTRFMNFLVHMPKIMLLWLHGPIL